jgi:hypothetical protein
MVDRMLELSRAVLQRREQISVLMQLANALPLLAQRLVPVALDLAEADGSCFDQIPVDRDAYSEFDATFIRLYCLSARRMTRRAILDGLDSLTPRLIRLEGDAAIAELGQTIQDIDAWFP